MPQLVKTDRTLFYTTVVMTLFGLLMVYSASSVMAKLRWGSDTHFAIRQGVFVVAGLITMMIFKRLNYRWLQGAGVAFGAVGVVVILLMLFRCDDSRDCSQLRATYGEASAEYQNCLRGSRSGGRTGGGSFGGYSSGGGHK